MTRAVIPVKPFFEAKRRLASVLNRAERAKLAERMFRHVLRVTSEVFGASEVLVISRARDVLAIAESARAQGLLETGPPNLNSALRQAAQFANARGFQNILVVASDLPFLRDSDLAEIARFHCAIAPDQGQRGTNALLWPTEMPFHFGEDSFARHRAAAENAGLNPAIIVRQGIGHDVDVPSDLADLYPNLARSSGSTRSA